MDAAISICEIKKFIRYDEDTGKFYWLERDEAYFNPGNQTQADRAKAWNSKNAGKEAGNTGFNGYRRISVLDKSHLAHRLAWAIYYGEWPSKCIDHINGDRADNRIANLRNVSKRENALNKRMSKYNTSGTVGVSWSPERGKWVAFINYGGGRKSLGRFSSKEDAIVARKHAEVVHGYHENHGRQAIGG